MTPLEKARAAIKKVDDYRLSDAERLAALRVLRDDVEDRIWQIKLASGIGLWKENQ